MTTATPADQDMSQDMLEVAAMWRQRMLQPGWTLDDEAQFNTWLEADQRHRRAISQIDDVWGFFGQHRASPESLTVRRDLLRRVQNETRGRWNGRWLSRRRLIGAGAGLAAATMLGLVWPLATQGDVYRTGVGERRTVILKDGSVLSLDAMSRVSVRYSDSVRQLTLTRGQARFDVAHDPARPFRVTARDRTVVATGTAFNIDIVRPEVRVTLLEGRVLVVPRTGVAAPLIDPPATAPVELRPGQGFVAGEGEAPRVVSDVDLQRATAWQKGKLVFDREPLAGAVERVNRYSERKITIDDPQVAALTISGVFNMGDLRAFLDAVTGTMPVRATEVSDGVALRSSDVTG
jgi:transmembrane sensor